MPTNIPGLEGLAEFTAADPGLRARLPADELAGGVDAARTMNDVIAAAIRATGVNADRQLDEDDLEAISDYIRGNAALYERFVEGHGNDEGNIETGYHLVQGDGGTLQFQNRAFVNTIADAIYHIGFEYRDGRFLNEDGNANERVDDVAGWLNWFVNGVNIVYGTEASETLNSGTYSVALSDAEDELFDAGGGNDSIWAGLGDDTIEAGNGNDRSGGGAGDDLMIGGAGNDSLWGEDGTDLIKGEDGDDAMGGGHGNDTIVGGEGADTLSGNEGDDRLRGGDGDDAIWMGTGNDRAQGQNGNDTIGGDFGNDSLYGGTGNDDLFGEEGRDLVVGGAGSDRVSGQEGNDTLRGNSGDDTLNGGDGNDMLLAGSGNDTVYGGTGVDSVMGSQGDDSIAGGDGNDQLGGGAGNDKLRGENGNDTLNGSSGNDDIAGQDGNDDLRGGTGDDRLVGGNGRDIFNGGAGADLLADWEDGNSRDIFVFNPGDTGVRARDRDTIEGFDSGTDRIDLTGFGGLEWIDEQGFDGSGAQVRFMDQRLAIDADGDGEADARIDILWVRDMNAGDLIL